jgi:hypothetical protein
MNIDRDDGAEHQARLDRMINEFRDAQARRFAKASDKPVESTSDANVNALRPSRQSAKVETS